MDEYLIYYNIFTMDSMANHCNDKGFNLCVKDGIIVMATYKI